MTEYTQDFKATNRKSLIATAIHTKIEPGFYVREATQRIERDFVRDHLSLPIAYYVGKLNHALKLAKVNNTNIQDASQNSTR